MSYILYNILNNFIKGKKIYKNYYLILDEELESNLDEELEDLEDELEDLEDELEDLEEELEDLEYELERELDMIFPPYFYLKILIGFSSLLYIFILIISFIMKNIHIIFNPASNRFKSHDILVLVREYLKKNNIPYKLHITQYQKHAQKITKELTSENKDKHLIVIGGDGTLHEVLNGIVDFEHTYLSVIPAGSGNDFVANFDNVISDNQIQNIERIVKQEWQYVDYIDINDGKVKSINATGFGIDANILKTYNTIKHFSDKTRYNLATVKNCLFFKVSNIGFKIDDNGWQKEKTIIFTIGNGKTFGSGIKITNTALVDDGYLNVVVVKKIPRILTIPLLVKFMKHGLNSLKYSTEYKCKKIDLLMDKQIYECDGEIYEDSKTLSIKIVSNKLKYII